MLGLSVAGHLGIFFPIHANIAIFSMAIIYLGCNRSLEELISEMVKVACKKGGSSNIETMTATDAMQFPFFAGGMLCGLYGLIKYFGKEYVNYIVLVYIAIGSTTGIKSLLLTISFDKLKPVDSPKLINIENSYFTLIVSPLDIISFILSGISVWIYIAYKSWVFNNLIAIVFCIHALQFIFLGNFKTGMLLLALLFFYDIFFVFGTDVMLTVAKNIDAPIKLMFPREPKEGEEGPQYSMLGLGDIVIPGIFVSLCLRFDFLKTLDYRQLYKSEGTPNADKAETVLCEKARNASKSYFIAVLIGYLIAIVATVVVMIVFDHGQPALLYLVPGCILSVLITSVIKGEFDTMWTFDETKYLENDEKKDK